MSLRLLLKIVLINHASADFICHHLCVRAKLNETKTQQDHQIHKTTPQDQYTFGLPAHGYR